MEQTIAAIATAMGEGGIGIVRISGEESRAILQNIFTRVKKEYVKNDGFLPDAQNEVIGSPLVPRMMHYGFIRDNFNGELIDEVMAVWFKAPYSYTAEDVVEIQCHGSIVSLRKILALVLKNGARLAEPGEFTKRAFLNGRLDLSQAEAVIDLIRAKSDVSFDVALQQLEGKLGSEVRKIRGNIMDLLVNITVNIDYPDEDIEELTYDNLLSGLQDVKQEMEGLLSTADTGRLLREGLTVSIIGKPNVGKSSLMNALLGEARAIVTEIPGTTRDTIEEMVSIRNIPVKLTDTAGIRQTDDVIEKIGIEKSKESFNQADMVLFMMDGSRNLDAEDEEIIAHLGERKCVVILNKSDLPQKVSADEIQKRIPQALILHSSLKEGRGADAVEDAICEMVYGGKVKQKNSVLVSNVRHKNLLEESLHSIEDAISMAEIRQPLEFIEIDVNRAYELSGEIIGESVSGDIINEVFARFCLGK